MVSLSSATSTRPRPGGEKQSDLERRATARSRSLRRLPVSAPRTFERASLIRRFRFLSAGLSCAGGTSSTIGSRRSPRASEPPTWSGGRARVRRDAPRGSGEPGVEGALCRATRSGSSIWAKRTCVRIGPRNRWLLPNAPSNCVESTKSAGMKRGLFCCSATSRLRRIHSTGARPRRGTEMRLLSGQRLGMRPLVARCQLGLGLLAERRRAIGRQPRPSSDALAALRQELEMPSMRDSRVGREETPPTPHRRSVVPPARGGRWPAGVDGHADWRPLAG
mgnify:CR=1 FL=1